MPSKTCSCINSVLDFVDIFRFPLTLTLNGAEKTSTYSGKIIAVGILLFFGFSLLQSDLLQKKNPNSFSQDINQNSHPKLLFDKSNFTMLIGIADDQNAFYVDNSIFSIFLYTYFVNNTSGNYNEKYYKLELCNPEGYGGNPNDFYSLGLNGTYCLPNEILKIGGYWNEETIDYFSIELYGCQNSSNNNYSCKSPTEINSYLQGLYLDIYITNHNFDTSNYENPIKESLNIFFQIIDPKLMKIARIFVKNTKFQTDDGVFFESLKIISSFILGNIENDVFSKANAEQDLHFYSLSVYSSDYQTEIRRSYQKAQTLLANLGGILQFLLFFGFFISKFENHYNVFSLISNELFTFHNIATIEKEKLKEKDLFDKKLHCSIKKKSEEKKKSNISKIWPNIIGNLKKSPTLEKKSEKLKTSFRIPKKNIINVNEGVFSLTERFPEKNFKNHDQLLFSNSSKNLEQKKNETEIDYIKETFSSSDIINPHRKSTPKGRSPSKWREKLKSIVALYPLSSSNSKKIISEEKSSIILDDLENYQKIKQKENYFKVGFFGFLKFLLKKNLKCCFKKFITNKEKMFHKAEEQIESSMDILVILKKLQEIEKLKRILFNDEQLYFFNLLSKPFITFEEVPDLLKKSNTHEEKIKLSFLQNANVEKEKLLTMYKNVQEKASSSDINKKILKLLDDDVKFFLHNEKKQI